MKPKFLFFLLFILAISCAKPTNSDEFIKSVSGRYLYTSDQLIEVYFKDKILFMKWKGIRDIEPMKIDNNEFFVKEMNEKIMFKTNPKNEQKYLVLVPKEAGATITYNFKKLTKDELIPSEYLENNEYEKALEGYLAIREKDSLDIAINESDMNRLGYYYLGKDNKEQALNIFKINVALHPYSYNVYDSLGETYLKIGDTLQALANYKKALIYDSGNKRVQRTIEDLEIN